MIARINEMLSKALPGLGRPKRHLLAQIAKFSSVKESYAQIGEDKIAIGMLQEMKLDAPIFYVDIGANHPTRLSNTYRMYREGGSGIVIEPNSELIGLHKTIRPRDIQLAVGCGKANNLLKFYYSKTPVLSSFAKSEVDELWSTDFLPVFTLDRICVDLSVERIDFLSIDVEGLDVDVLDGATQTLRKTRLVCIEANNDEAEQFIMARMAANGFRLALKNKWNLFFVPEGKT